MIEKCWKCNTELIEDTIGYSPSVPYCPNCQQCRYPNKPPKCCQQAKQKEIEVLIAWLKEFSVNESIDRDSLIYRLNQRLEEQNG